MAKDRTKDLTQGTPWKVIAGFSLPVIGGNLFQLFYTLADSMIVGRTLGADALAAVGATATIVYFVLCFIQGLTGGCGILLGQAFGAGNEKQVRESVSASVWISALFTIVLTVLCCSMVHPILRMLNTPVDIYDRTYTYLFIIFLGNGATVFYNMMSNSLRALGDSRTPLYFLIFSSVFNIVLDWIFVANFHLDVAGVAWATLIAQGASVVGSFTILLKELQTMEGNADGIFAKEELLPMTKIALPSILQQSTVSIGMMLVQSVVNSFGAEALAGFSAGMRIESICIVPMVAIGNAISSYTAQNIGAGQQKRVVKGYVQANKLVIFFAVLICVVLELFPEQLIALFLGTEGSSTALATGQAYLGFMGFFFCMIGFKMAVDGVLRGAGDMKMFTIANLVNLSIRVSMAMMLAPRFGIECIWYAVPIGWTANFVISYLEYRTGKWKTIKKI